MKTLRTYAAEILLLILALASAPVEAQRVPLEAKPLLRIDHRPTAPRMRVDPGSGAWVEYALEGMITASPGGDFVVSWNGRNGERHRLLWVPPNKVRAEVVAAIEYDQDSGLYTYTYALRNAASSEQSVRTLYIEAADIVRTDAPSERWYSRPLTEYLQGELGVDGWAWSAVLGARRGLAPGELEEGFQVVSGLGPGLVKVYVSGFRESLVSSGEEIPDELHEALDEAYWNLPSGTTIGPSEGQTRSSVFESTMQLLFQSASGQGWLGGTPTREALLNALSSVRSARLAGDSAEVERLLEVLESEIDRGVYRGVLVEGRSLLELLRPRRDAERPRAPLVRDVRGRDGEGSRQYA